MGLGLSILTILTDKAKKRGLTDEEIHSLATPNGERYIDQLVENMAAARNSSFVQSGRKTIARIEQSFPLILDYNISPVAMLEATGCNYIYEWMKTHHPAWNCTGTVEVMAHLINMGRDWDRNEALVAIQELDLRPAPDNAALWTLSGSKEHFDIQRKVWIVDPETVWLGKDDDQCVAFLNGFSDYRFADLDRIAYKWDCHFRVLALSK
ncbi:MAG: hypothetical protein WC025_03015 [Candidatus Magasanikbacteria bacterium]